ncbi:hypothetical protein, partial [uncultured Algibacter sp.]|uniref:thioesterase domain-containing protein n=1 Tax=uncultured Algibacter sp. TaxID=298659 RepID=UPI00260422D0
MANDFVKEIKAVSPKGPYHIMGYCFSTPVALEISRILKKENQSVNLIIADTIAINENRTAPDKTNRRIKGFLDRLKKNPFNAIYRYIDYRYKMYIKPFMIRNFSNKINKNVQILRDNLAKNYLKYDWIPFDLYISLLITKKTDPTYNPEIIESWNSMTEKKEVKIFNIKGTHWQLFLEPTVKNTAIGLEKSMELFEDKKKNSNGTY